MKKISYFFLVVLSILVTTLVINEYNEDYYYKTLGKEIIEDQLMKNQISFIMQVPSNTDETIKELIDFSERNNVPVIVLNGMLDSRNKNKTSFYIYGREINIGKNIYFDKGIDVDFTNTNEKGYYTTDVNDKKSTDTIHLLSGKYRDGSNHPIIEIKPLYQYVEDIKKKDNFLQVGFLTNDFEKTKAKMLKEIRGVDKNMIEGFYEYPVDDREESITSNLQLIIITMVIIVLLLSCDIFKKMKDISIRKMNGNSTGQIISMIFGRFFIFGLLFFVLGMVGTYAFLVGEISPMALNIIRKLVQVLVVFIISYIALSIIICIIIKLVATAVNMKKQHINYTLVYINLVLKLVLMVMVITPFLSTIPIGIRGGKDLYIINKYNDRDKYRYSIGNMYTDGGVDDIQELNNTNIMNLKEQVFNAANAAGATYISTDQIDSDVIFSEDGKLPENYVPLIVVNKRYLKDYNITLEDGSKLDLESINEGAYIIPKCHKDKKLSDYDGYNYEGQLEVIKVKDGMNYYSPEGDFNGKRVFNDPIIIVSEKYLETTGTMERFIYFEDDDLMREKFEAAGLTGKYEFTNSDARVQEEIKWATKEFLITLGELILYIFIILVFLYESVFLYMEEAKHFMSVQYLFGQSAMKRYGKMVTINLVPHVALFIIGMLFLKLPFIKILSFCIIFMIIELLYMIYMIKSFEKNRVVSVLKGE